jgi:hypothetical protein
MQMAKASAMIFFILFLQTEFSGQTSGPDFHMKGL